MKKAKYLSLQVNLFQKLSFLHPLYDNRLFIELQKKLQVQHMLCTQIGYFFLFWHSKQFVYTTCAELVFFCNSMNNLLSYYRLIDARMRASDKDFPLIYVGKNWKVVKLKTKNYQENLSNIGTVIIFSWSTFLKVLLIQCSDYLFGHLLPQPLAQAA